MSISVVYKFEILFDIFRKIEFAKYQASPYTEY